jgi:chorismate--pyruvate lyase
MSRIKSHWSSRLPHALAARPYYPWLRERGSLTARWQKASGAFRVEPVRQALLPPLADERAALGLPPRRCVWVRDVVLYCGATPVAFAHTATAVAPRVAVQRWLRQLGRRSLGTLLFSHPGFVSLGVDYAVIDARHPLHHGIFAHSQAGQKYWARRTLFAFGKQRIALTEVFLPAVLDY